MSEFQEDYSFQCPFCASEISVMVDLTGGEEQTFTTDCEVCCRPILINLTADEEGVTSFTADRESD